MWFTHRDETSESSEAWRQYGHSHRRRRPCRWSTWQSRKTKRATSRCPFAPEQRKPPQRLRVCEKKSRAEDEEEEVKKGAQWHRHLYSQRIIAPQEEPNGLSPASIYGNLLMGVASISISNPEIRFPCGRVHGKWSRWRLCGKHVDMLFDDWVVYAWFYLLKREYIKNRIHMTTFINWHGMTHHLPHKIIS